MGKEEPEYDVEAGEKAQVRKVATNDSSTSSGSSVKPAKRARYVVIVSQNRSTKARNVRQL